MVQNMKHDPSKYNAGARFFHWASAFLILILLPMGFYMGGMEFSPAKLQVIGLHKSLGLSVLLLVLMRISWRIFFKPPSALSTHEQWERLLSKTIHVVLYIAILFIPISGWVMSSAGDFPISFFGLFEMPNIVQKDENIFEFSRSVHEYLALVIIGCVGLHVIGALKHQWIDKDATMQRMGASSLLGFLAILFLGAATLLWGLGELSHYGQGDVRDTSLEQQIGASESVVQVFEDGLEVWSIDSENSEIGFTFLQYGSSVNGSFGSFAGDIVFDPDDLDHATAVIEIDAASIKTGSADRDGQAISQDWFAADSNPTITFKSDRFSKLSANQYEVEGQLEIKGIALPVSFPFVLDIHDLRDGYQEAIMVAELELDRTAFHVGEGQWESGEAIDKVVKINLKLRAVK